MTEINSSTGIVECHLWIEELLQFDGLRNGAVCAGCSTIVGAHARRSGMSSFKFSEDTQFSIRLSRTGNPIHKTLSNRFSIRRNT
jgi:hypothetical protein